jgi:hypothetical protein
MSKELTNSAEDALPDGELDQERSAASLRSNQPPTPPRSNSALYDYSDVESVGSQNSMSTRRRRQRGGQRRKRDRKPLSVLQSATELEIPKTVPQEPELQADAESTGSTPPQEEYDEEQLRKARSSRTHGSTSERSSTKEPRKDTGIKAFSVATAESSGRRPVGITIERPKQAEKQRRESDGKGTTKTDEKPEGGRREEEEDTETDTRKPVSIRLDLNLEVEILLRAKIKGDITITFL